ncbi:unnamed protein product [Schistosoma margrebowiei]|uniref:Uncharacterized protein n=1 Tax=Schistosoma margrebowiei TaxID=48269 RepID=A0AA85A009_9TREM|nr:unnamed protein product [Schistosoma margrebowiei]
MMVLQFYLEGDLWLHLYYRKDIITNQQYSSIFSLHNQMDQALLVFTGLCRLMFCQNRTV